MLPFLKPRPQTGVVITQRMSDHGVKPDTSDQDYDSIEACATDLIRAVHAKDAQAVCKALRAAFEIMDSEPHEEGEHTNESPSPHTYEAQNIKAAK